MINYLKGSEEAINDQLLYDVRLKKHGWYIDGGALEPEVICEIKRGHDIVVLTKNELIRVLNFLNSNKLDFVIEVDD